MVTDTVDGLRSHASRTMELVFDHEVETVSLARLKGVEVSADGPRRLRLTITGLFVRCCAQSRPLDPVDILSRPADLDELFVGYY